MDNLTHSLVGAALARTGLDRTTPLATATLVVAANAPDVDMLAFARGEWFALAFRRGVTHGIPALAVLPFAVACAVTAWDRMVRRRTTPDAPPARFGALLALAFLGVLTHPTLDWMNTYGMRWWLPLDGEWTYGDTLFIIDPWLWLLLGAGVALAATRTRAGHAGWILLAALTSLVVVGTSVTGPLAKGLWLGGILAIALARTLGRPRTPDGGLRLARALTAGAAVYVVVMMGASRLAALDVLRAVDEAGIPIEAAMVQPLPANPLEFEVVVQTPDRYLRGSHRWGRAPRVTLGDLPDIPRGPTNGIERAAVEAARRHPDVAHYLIWSRFPFWFVDADDEHEASVRVGDARYVARTGALSGLTVVVELPTGE